MQAPPVLGYGAGLCPCLRLWNLPLPSLVEVYFQTMDLGSGCNLLTFDSSNSVLRGQVP